MPDYGPLTRRAATLANQGMRKAFTDDPSFAKRLGTMRKQSAATMAQSWSPFVADPQNGLSLRLRDNDSMLLMDFGEMTPTSVDIGMLTAGSEQQQIALTDELTPGQRIQQIVFDAFQQALDEDPTALIEDLLQRIVG